MKHCLIVLFLIMVGTLCTPVNVMAQEPARPTEERINRLESRVASLDYEVRSFARESLVLFLFDAFCALWAQNTRRNPWVWFFLGLLFSVISVIVLLVKNSNERKG